MNERNARILTFLLLLASCSAHAQSAYFFKTTASLELQLKDTQTSLSAEVLDGIGQELNSRMSRAQAIEQLQQKLNKALETEDYFAADTIKKELDRRISVRDKIDELRQGIKSSLAAEDYDKAEEFKGSLIYEYKKLPKENTNQPLKANSDSDQVAAAAIEEEKRREIEAQEQREAQELAEQKRKEAEAQKQREAQELADKKAEQLAEKKRQEDEERLKREEEQRKAEELAAKKVKEEEEEQKAADLAARLAEERRRANELEAKLEEEKRKADELAARLAEEDRIRQERITAEEAERKRRIEEEESERRRLIAEEEERKLQEQKRRELARKLAEETERERQASIDRLVDYEETVSQNIYSEDFDNSQVDFTVTTVSDRWKGPHNGAYESRQYGYDIKGFNYTTLNININQEKDYAISSNVLYIKGDRDNFMGIVWGGSDNSFFMFGINKNGDVTVFEYESGQLRKEHFHQDKCSVLKENWTNHLRVVKRGTYWIFVINDKIVHRMPYSGVYGINAGFALPYNATARFDNFSVDYLVKE
jgi:hypothetical protein